MVLLAGFSRFPCYFPAFLIRAPSSHCFASAVDCLSRPGAVSQPLLSAAPSILSLCSVTQEVPRCAACNGSLSIRTTPSPPSAKLGPAERPRGGSAYLQEFLFNNNLSILFFFRSDRRLQARGELKNEGRAY